MNQEDLSWLNSANKEKKLLYREDVLRIWSALLCVYSAGSLCAVGGAVLINIISRHVIGVKGLKAGV